MPPEDEPHLLSDASDLEAEHDFRKWFRDWTLSLVLAGAVLFLSVGFFIILVDGASTRSQLREENDLLRTQLEKSIEDSECRSTIVNAQAEADANLSIEDAHNDAVTSRALDRISRGEDFTDLSEELRTSADELDALSNILQAKTDERTSSVETCRAD